jgi:hypothetical protein
LFAKSKEKEDRVQMRKKYPLAAQQQQHKETHEQFSQ